MSDGAKTITVLLVDDHTLLREALRESLAQEEDFEFVGDAGDGDTAVGLAAEAKPQVILMDVEMPGDDIRTRLSRIQLVSPSSRVIILSMYEDARLIQDLVAQGIRGYLVKSASRMEVVSAIRSVATYDTRLVLSVPQSSVPGVGGPDPGPLSEREMDVLHLVREGLTNGQIASKLYIAEGTVKRHLRNIYAKLDAVSRVDAVNKAMAESILPGPRGTGGAASGTVRPR